MLTALNGTRKLSLTLVAILLGCLAAPAGGDEARFQVEGEHLLLSVKVPTFLKSQTFAELKKKSVQAARKITSGVEENLGVAGDNIERIIIGVGAGPNNSLTRITIGVTTKNPVTFNDIKAKLAPGAREFDWKERKVAGFTIHTPGDNPDQALRWQPFCVAKDKVVLNGSLASIKKILERTKAPNLAAGMRAGLKEASPDNALSIVIDVQRLLAENEENTLPGQQVPIPREAKGVNVVVIKANETDKFTASALFICKDAAAAAGVHGMINLVSNFAKNSVNGNLPPAQLEKNKALLTLVNAVTVSSVDNRVTATLTVEPAAVATLLQLIYAPPPDPAPKANGRQE